MPGKPSSTATRPTRRPAAAKTTAQKITIPDEGEDSSLRHAVCKIFGDVQKSTAGHRQAAARLRKIQDACCYEPSTPQKASQLDQFEQDDFNREFLRCLIRVLPVKKSETVADRVVRFVGTFLTMATNKDAEIFEQYEEDMAEDTPSNRLTVLILKTLTRALQAKDKNVRFRATQIISHILHSVDEVDPTMCTRLRHELLQRLRDKEAVVRLQAVHGLSRLLNNADDGSDTNDTDSENEVDTNLLHKLRSLLNNDPSAEVRRGLLLNLVKLPNTRQEVEQLLERARDVDVATRRAVFARALPSLPDFRQNMSKVCRAKMLYYGLKDRDESVRKAAAKLFRESWIEVCAARPGDQPPEEREAEEDGGEAQPKSSKQAAQPSMEAIIELLERIDVDSHGMEDSFASLAMQEFWAGRPDYVEYVSFPDQFWEDLNTEEAFLVRSFNDFCRSTGQESSGAAQQALYEMAEKKLPEVTKFALLLERELKKLIDVTALAATEPNDDDDDEELRARGFIVYQMLCMALTFDYSDEMGRRRMLGLMRDSLTLVDLPNEIVRLAVDVLRLLCGRTRAGEKDFAGMVIDDIFALQQVLDTDSANAAEYSILDESFHSATSFPDDEDGENNANRSDGGNRRKAKSPSPRVHSAEEVDKELRVESRCLLIALCMMQNIFYDIHQDKRLEDYVGTHVRAAIKSSDWEIKERGLQCLGLACILGKTYAKDYLDYFILLFSDDKDIPESQQICLQSISDIITVHPSLFPSEPDSDSSNRVKLILKTLSQSLKSENMAVQATGAIAISKAMLQGLITNLDLLKHMVISYFDPENLGQPHFQQALSYFFPTYCHSRAENAIRMAQITCNVISKMVTLREDFFDNADPEVEIPGEGVLKINTVSQMLIDWTDPRKLVYQAAGAGNSHYCLAENILERLNTTQVAKEEKKVLFTMLGKLHFPPDAGQAEVVQSILELTTEAIDSRVATDEVSKKMLTKLRSTFLDLVRDVMTAERGGGGAEETVFETTEVDPHTLRPSAEDTTEYAQVTATAAGRDEEDEDEDEDEEDEEESEDDAEQQLQREIRESTELYASSVAGFTTGLPDAEGTRIQDFYNEGTTVEDTEMMDIDG